MCARGKETLEQTAESIRRQSAVKVVDVAADVSDPKDAARVVKAAFDEFGQREILFTMSRGPPSGPDQNLPSEMWDTAAHLLLKSAVDLTRVLLPGMKVGRWGRI